MVLYLRVLEIRVKIHNNSRVQTVQLVRDLHKIRDLQQQI